MKLEIRFVRHGLTVSNEAHKYLGRTDEGLSEQGKAKLGERHEPDLLFVSPMRRCRETAELLFPGREGICIPEWTEIDFGDFEGRSFEELKDVPAYQAWLESAGRLPFPNGESREDFIARSMQGYERMLTYIRAYFEKKSDAEKKQMRIRSVINEEGKTERRAKVESASDEGMSVAAVVNGGTVMAVCSSLFGGDYYDYQISCGGEYLCPAVLI